MTELIYTQAVSDHRRELLAAAEDHRRGRLARRSARDDERPDRSGPVPAHRTARRSGSDAPALAGRS